MANRSDRMSILPRHIKRMLALCKDDLNPHRAGELRRLFIDAHAIEKQFKNKKIHDSKDVEESKVADAIEV